MNLKSSPEPRVRGEEFQNLELFGTFWNFAHPPGPAGLGLELGSGQKVGYSVAGGLSLKLDTVVFGSK